MSGISLTEESLLHASSDNKGKSSGNHENIRSMLSPSGLSS